jgi:hypothetical protein
MMAWLGAAIMATRPTRKPPTHVGA